MLGWTRAVLLQLAHPLIAAAVADHSTFRGSTVGAFSRLHHTVNAMLAITFGDEHARNRALDAIRTIHLRVHGTLPAACGRFPAGTPYSAEDPALVLWVHATLVESILYAYEQLIAPLNDSERDRYCVDSVDVAVALGAVEGDVPRRWPALRGYLDREHASGSIAVSGQARDVAAALLSPVPGPAGAPVAALMTLLAAGMLPADIRRQYGFAWSLGRERMFVAGVRAARTARPLLPRWIAWWPHARRWAASVRSRA